MRAHFCIGKAMPGAFSEYRLFGERLKVIHRPGRFIWPMPPTGGPAMARIRADQPEAPALVRVVPVGRRRIRPVYATAQRPIDTGQEPVRAPRDGWESQR